MNYYQLPVVLLCGGKGERLRPLTNEIPKPLIEIKGKAIISYQLEYLKKIGLSRYIIATGYKTDKFEAFFRNYEKDFEIVIIDSGDVDIMKRIKDSSSMLNSDFLVCYGDTLADVNIKSLYEFHNSHNGLVSMTAFPMSSSFGVIDIDKNGRVKEYREKPILNHWMNIGYMLFSIDALDCINSFSNFVEFLLHLVSVNKLYSFRHRGLHITVNTVKELQDAEGNIANFNESIRIHE
jgi:glucose-1-phosphate cytidylyltransferase